MIVLARINAPLTPLLMPAPAALISFTKQPLSGKVPFLYRMTNITLARFEQSKVMQLCVCVQVSLHHIGYDLLI
jgi:hypothetical protein